MRCFIAINLPESVGKILAGLQHEFKKYGADIRWVRPEHIHLTLKFLGSIEEKSVDALAGVIEKACTGCTAFQLTVSGAGVFPNMKSPRVLWIGLDSSVALSGLQEEIDRGAASLGFKQEHRKFVPHLTLGRFRSSRIKQGFREKIESYENSQFGAFDVGSVCLMKSDLGPSGATYSIIKEIFLGANKH